MYVNLKNTVVSAMLLRKLRTIKNVVSAIFNLKVPYFPR
jgi:hypothetical protein